MSEESKEKQEELTGVVVFFNDRKGYGFIKRDDGKGDAFCHYSHIQMNKYKTLNAGQKVSFTIGQNHKGPQAENIKVIGESEKNDEEQSDESQE